MMPKLDCCHEASLSGIYIDANSTLNPDGSLSIESGFHIDVSQTHDVPLEKIKENWGMFYDDDSIWMRIKVCPFCGESVEDKLPQWIKDRRKDATTG